MRIVHGIAWALAYRAHTWHSLAGSTIANHCPCAITHGCANG